MRRNLKALLRAATAFFFRLMLGFSKYWRFRNSERIPAFSHCFLNRLNAFSKGSFSPTLIPAIHFPSLLIYEYSIKYFQFFIQILKNKYFLYL